MCGIAGIVSSGPFKGLITPERIKSMTDSIRHRGPDGEGMYLEETDTTGVGLGHRRLAIIDPTERSVQPMHYLDKYVVIHNGEIYNFKEIRLALEQKGYRFRSMGDAEVIAAAWHEFGPECVHRFEGMFAFALWDRQRQMLFCARDRFGEKPFFFHYDDQTGMLRFASEMKALWTDGVKKKTRPQMFLHFLTLGMTQHPDMHELTFYQDIFRLPPAHTLTFTPRGNRLVISRYWDIDKETIIDIGEDEALRHFRNMFEASVNSRMHSDVKEGFAISGGIDSTAIAAAYVRNNRSGQACHSFSAVFPGFEKDESSYIREVNEAFGLQANIVTPNAEGLLEKMHLMAFHQEEPFGSAGVFAQFEVHAMAVRQGIKVLFDGQGADETLSGYPKYTHWYLQELIAAKQFSRAEQEAGALMDNGFLAEWGWRNKAAAFMPGFTSAMLERKARRLHEGNHDIDQKFMEAYSGAGFIQKPVVEKLNDILYADTCTGGLETLLRYADRNAMAHGLELRLPFLQHELVSFVFSLPASFRIRKGVTKWILRECYRTSIPENILRRKGKIGFEPPQADWMQDDRVKGDIRKGQQKLVDAGMLNPAVLSRDIKPSSAYAPDNRDWRYWVVSQFL